MKRIVIIALFSLILKSVEAQTISLPKMEPVELKPKLQLYHHAGLIGFLLLYVFFPSSMVWAQFIDRFEGNTLDAGWETSTGDGYVFSSIS